MPANTDTIARSSDFTQTSMRLKPACGARVIERLTFSPNELEMVIVSNPNEIDPNARKLLEAVHSLALSGRDALGSIPDGPDRPDRLALLFDEEYTDFMEGLAVLPSESQLLALQLLDRAVNAISGPENRHLWTEAAVERDPHWEEIRQLAQSVLHEFGWRASSAEIDP